MSSSNFVVCASSYDRFKSAFKCLAHILQVHGPPMTSPYVFMDERKTRVEAAVATQSENTTKENLTNQEAVAKRAKVAASAKAENNHMVLNKNGLKYIPSAWQ